jgi:hypothetical protein
MFVLERGQRLTFEMRNTQPVELLDLTDSLAAFASRFSSYAEASGIDPDEGRARLYIREIRSGSIIAELVSLLQQTTFLLEHDDVLGGFVTHIAEIIQFLLKGDQEQLPKEQVQDIAQIVEPIAKDHGSQLNLVVRDNVGDVTINTVVITSEDAQTIRRRATRRLQPQLETSDRSFTKEVLTLFQARDDAKSQSGDRGIIDKFSPKPLKLIFENEAAKKAILDLDVNPFKVAFVVDGELMMSTGKPAAYKIKHVHEHFERPS